MATSANRTSAAASVTIDPRETRTLEGVLVLIGVAMLVFGGFVAAYPLRLGTSSSAATTSSRPVTLSHLTTIGTTPTVVTEVTLASTSSESSGRTADAAWLGTIFGIGTLVVLSGALFRRVTSLSGFGVKIGLSGVVNDPATQARLAERIEAGHPDATPEQAMRIYAASLTRVQEAVARRQVSVAPQRPGRPPWARERLSILAERVRAPTPPRVTVAAPAGLAATDEEIARAVDEAAAEVLPET